MISKTKKQINHLFKKENNVIFLIGKTFGHLEESAFLEEVQSITEGLPPEVNLTNEKNNGETVLEIIKNDLAQSVHDISSGGMLVALAEMSLESGIGPKINKPKNLTNLFGYFFGEDQSRYIVEIEPKNQKKVEQILKNNNVFYENIGFTQKDYFEVHKELKILIKDLYKINNKWYNVY